MTVLGVGIDVVDIASFAAQLDDPASGFAAGTFTAGERADAARRPGADATHLAARFAVKEAFIKAWSSARAGEVPALPDGTLDLRDIELVADPFGRPLLHLHGAVAEAVTAMLGTAPGARDLLVSLSHDGPVATAVVVLQQPAWPPPQPPAPEENLT